MTFLLNVLFARLFTASVSGEIFYLFAVFTFIIQGIGFSLESGVAYYSARGEIPGNKLTGIMLSWSMAAGIIVLLAFIIIKYYNPELPYPITYPVCFVLGNLLINYGNGYCNSKFRFMLPNIVSVSVSLLLILLLLFDGYVRKTPFDFIDIYFYSFVLQGALLFIFILSGEKLQLSFSLADLKPVIKYSGAAFIANLLTLVLHRIDYVFVKEYVSANELGNYIQVSRISQLCMLLPSMVSTVLFPYMISGNKADMKIHVRKISTVFLIIFSSLSVFLAITGYWLFPFLYGDSFNNMYMPFMLMAPGIICICALYPYSTYFAASNSIKTIIIAVLAGVMVVILGDSILIPHFGINAAAGVRSLAYMAYLFIIILKFKK